MTGERRVGVCLVIIALSCQHMCLSVWSKCRAKDHFMLVTDTEFMLVNPDMNRLGCGIVKFVAFLQVCQGRCHLCPLTDGISPFMFFFYLKPNKDVEVAADPADNSALYITAHHRIEPQAKMKPALNAKIVFEDHIRCLATKQSIQKHKEQLRHDKMACIAALLNVNISQLFNQLSISAHPPSPLLGTDATDSVQVVSSSRGTSPKLIHSIANKTLSEENQTAGTTDEKRPSEIYEMDVLDESNQSLAVVNEKTLTSSKSSDSVRYSPVSQQISITSTTDWKAATSTDTSKQPQEPADESLFSDHAIVSVEPLGEEKRSSSPLPKEEVVYHSASSVMATSNSIFPTLTFDMSSEHIIAPTKTGISLASSSSSTGTNSGNMGMSFGGIGILAREPGHEERTPSPRQPARKEGNLIILDPESPQLVL